MRSRHCLMSTQRAMVPVMTTHLPNGERAILDIGKLEDYCLSPTHPRGRHKARVFRQALALHHEDAFWLRAALLEAAATSEAVPVATDAWGNYWQLDVVIRRHLKRAVVRTLWIVRTGDDLPRLVTCWVV
jgi:hypothetical protein